MDKNIYEVLTDFLNEIGITENAAGSYLGNSTEYAVYRAAVNPSDYADDTDADEMIEVEIHYIAPHGRNILETRRNIRRGIKRIFGQSPRETEGSDRRSQYFLYEWTTQEGEGWQRS